MSFTERMIFKANISTTKISISLYFVLLVHSLKFYQCSLWYNWVWNWSCLVNSHRPPFLTILQKSLIGPTNRKPKKYTKDSHKNFSKAVKRSRRITNRWFQAKQAGRSWAIQRPDPWRKMVRPDGSCQTSRFQNWAKRSRRWWKQPVHENTIFTNSSKSLH